MWKKEQKVRVGHRHGVVVVMWNVALTVTASFFRRFWFLKRAVPRARADAIFEISKTL
jgi:hypothetical protein